MASVESLETDEVRRQRWANLQSIASGASQGGAGAAILRISLLCRRTRSTICRFKSVSCLIFVGMMDSGDGNRCWQTWAL